MLNIDDELKKMKDYLTKNITLGVDIVPNFDKGNKIKITGFYMEEGKMRKHEWSFFIKYDKNKDNYANASYLLHCDYDYKDGGSGYADKYESIDDFINTRQTQELLKEYGRDYVPKQTSKYEEISLFDLDNEEDEPVDEEVNVSSDDMQLSIFDEIDTKNNNIDLKDLMSYGVDDYYNEHLKGETFGIIKENLANVPKYKEYYDKLKEYLKQYLPVKDLDTTGWSFTGKCMFIHDDTIIVRSSRQQCPVYCYSMIPKGIID